MGFRIDIFISFPSDENCYLIHGLPRQETQIGPNLRDHRGDDGYNCEASYFFNELTNAIGVGRQARPHRSGFRCFIMKIIFKYNLNSTNKICKRYMQERG